MIDRPAPRERRRRVAVLLVFVIGGLASIATSPPPTPPPALTSEASGTIVVTKDEPIVSVDISVEANAGLRAGGNSRTQVSIGGFGTDPSLTGQASMVAITPLDDAEIGSPVATAPSLLSRLDATCGVTGDCLRRYRITVMLIDPDVETASFKWNASAGTHITVDGVEKTTPPDADLDITAAEPVARGADAIAVVVTPTDQLRLDADHPRSIRTVTLRRPVGPALGVDPGAGAILRLVAPGDNDPPSYQETMTATVFAGSEQVGSARGSGSNLSVPLSLAACETDGGCETELRVEFDWAGGDPEFGATVDWSILAWTMSPEGAADAGALGLTTGPGVDLGPDSQRISDVTTGTFEVTRSDSQVRATATVVLDTRGLPQGGPDVAGIIQATLVASTDGDAEKGVTLWMDGSYVEGNGGDELTVVAAPVPVTCAPKSICSVTFDLSGGTSQHDARFDWTLSVGLLLEPPLADPAGVTIDVATKPTT